MIVPKRLLGCSVLLLFTLGLITLTRSKLNPFMWIILALVPEPDVIPYISHVVLFQFKAGTSTVDVKEISSKMLGLRKSCLHPSTGMPYIVSITGGKDISIEKQQNGITHAFVLRFYSKEDRNYYVENDPVHLAFKEAAAAVLEKIQTIDFQEGMFY